MQSNAKCIVTSIIKNSDFSDDIQEYHKTTTVIFEFGNSYVCIKTPEGYGIENNNDYVTSEDMGVVFWPTWLGIGEYIWRADYEINSQTVHVRDDMPFEEVDKQWNDYVASLDDHSQVHQEKPTLNVYADSTDTNIDDKILDMCDDGAINLTVMNKHATIELSDATCDALSDLGSDVTVSLDKVETDLDLNLEGKFIGAYRMEATTDGKSIQQLGGNVSVSLKGLTDSGYDVYKLEDDGDLVPMKTYLKDGECTFETGETSTFVVVDGASHNPEWWTLAVVGILAACIIPAILIVRK